MHAVNHSGFQNLKRLLNTYKSSHPGFNGPGPWPLDAERQPVAAVVQVTYRRRHHCIIGAIQARLDLVASSSPAHARDHHTKQVT